jgi:uroporphyrin-III C-methyltransferase / precorrin-2 dehydrogenase / sirohydrochlorin ferrochelatase
MTTRVVAMVEGKWMAFANASSGLFPLFWKLDGQRVLVVGGGDEALAKVRLLLPCGAAVTVVDPAPCAALRAATGVALIERSFRPADLDGARLCVVAVEDAAEAASIATAARAAGILVNAVDRPELCDVIVPAIVNRPPVTIAIGTGGAAPALARDLRGRIEAAVPPGYGPLAALCRSYRAEVAAALPDRAARRRFWDSVIGGPAARAALDGDMAEAERLLRAALAGGVTAAAGEVVDIVLTSDDPDLLTLRDVRRLKSADVVVVGAGVPAAVVEMARREARLVDGAADTNAFVSDGALVVRLLRRP